MSSVYLYPVWLLRRRRRFWRTFRMSVAGHFQPCLRRTPILLMPGCCLRCRFRLPLLWRLPSRCLPGGIGRLLHGSRRVIPELQPPQLFVPLTMRTAAPEQTTPAHRLDRSGALARGCWLMPHCSSAAVLPPHPHQVGGRGLHQGYLGGNNGQHGNGDRNQNGDDCLDSFHHRLQL
ncbi:hypothetical protein SAMN04488087_0517 [Rhodothermus profundi]|uniref:Uncharacterized protein n=1 Tax=Rhodothermus profundi TaxID=633813 RepID=A0A1M6Q977_9BACT|nr:hypothetical protein SAMN04488087_0517 [Rhodothermus profundi]